MTPPRNGYPSIDVTEAPGPRVTLTKPAGDAPPPPPSAIETGPGGERLMPPAPRLPRWVRDPRAHLAWWARYLYRVAGAWALESVAAAGKAARRSLYRGPRKAVERAHRWATDPTSKALLDQLAGRTATADWLRVSEERRKSVGEHRGAVAVGAGLVVVLVAIGAVLTGDWPLKILTAAVWVAVMGGWQGRDPADPLFTPVVLKDPKYRKLEPDQLHRAFIAAGLASEPGRPGKPGPLEIVVNPHREGPTAQVATIDLPAGKTVTDAIKVRERIASGLRCQSSCLFLSPDRFSPDTHDGRVILRQTRTDPMAADPVRTPLLTMESTDIFGALPVGLDERGDIVTISPLWRSILFSGQARTGKSFSARLLTLGMVLDPTVRVGAVFCAKGSSDHRPLARLAHVSGFGRDDDVRRRLAAALRLFCDEIPERNGEMAKLPISERREGKLTKSLARRFPVTLILLEEVQDYFSSGDTKDKLGREIESLVKRIVKSGPSCGFIVVLCTQRPDKESVPPALKDQFQIRVGFRNTGDAVQVMALGSGSADSGWDVRTLPAGERYRGSSFAVGEGLPERYWEGGTFCKWHLADEEDADAIIDRAFQARIDRELLSGMAAGEDVDTGVVTLLDDVAAVFRSGDTWLWSHQIIARLNDEFPGRYRFDGPQAFGVTARTVGLTTEAISQRVDGKPVTNAGVRLDVVAQALDERAQRLEQDDDEGDEAA